MKISDLQKIAKKSSWVYLGFVKIVVLGGNSWVRLYHEILIFHAKPTQNISNKWYMRWYQEGAIQKLRSGLSLGLRRQLLVMPTGAGKTVTFVNLAASAAARGSKTVILTDRTELMSQSGRALLNRGLDFFILHGSQRNWQGSKVMVSMIDTFVNRCKKDPDLLDLDIYVLDEAHKGSYAKFLKMLPEKAVVIGATATPMSLSKNYVLKDYWQGIVNPVSIAQLISEGFLCDAITYSHNKKIEGLKVERGDYSEESQYKALNCFYTDVAQMYKKHLDGLPTMVFNINIQHSKEVCEQFNALGIRSMHVDSYEDNNKEILEAFARREFDVLHSVGMLTTGYDAPFVRGIILNRKTKSLPLYLQMCGRGSRPFESKKIFKILDIGQNFKEFGFWQQDRDWDEIWQGNIKSGNGVAPVKLCPECDAMLKTSARKCPYCGHVYVKKRIEGELMELHEVSLSDLSLVERLIISQGQKKNTWLIYEIARNSVNYEEYKKHLKELVNRKGYKTNWMWVMRQMLLDIWNDTKAKQKHGENYVLS